MGRARPQRALEHRLRLRGLGGERDLVGDARRPAALPVVGPTGGQVERAVQEGMPARAGVGEEDADLGVRGPPRRAAVLRLHPRRLGALLAEARFVDHQDARGVAQVRHDGGPQVVAHRVGIPHGAVEERLEALSRCW